MSMAGMGLQMIISAIYLIQISCRGLRITWGFTLVTLSDSQETGVG
jgi:hypothetical protein